jgi:hypothetical protein
MTSTGKVVAALAVLGIGGAIAYASAGDSGGAAPGDVTSGGMLLSGDCSRIEVVDVGQFMTAFMRFSEDKVADNGQIIDGATPEDLMIAFLAKHFRDCFPPAPGQGFVWVTNHPTRLERSWGDVMADVEAMFELAPPGWEGESDAPPDWEEIGNAAATTPIDPVDPIVEPSWTGWPMPTPDPPAPEGDGEGDGWTQIPNNVLQAQTHEDMLTGGVARAMESDGALSPQPGTIFVVFDEEWPAWDAMSADLYEYAADHPEILFVVASTADTREALGEPTPDEDWGAAVNAADRKGVYRDADAVRLAWTADPLSASRWDALLTHAESPQSASFTT